MRNLSVIPVPQKVIFSDEIFTLSEGLIIECETDINEIQVGLDILSESLSNKHNTNFDLKTGRKLKLIIDKKYSPGSGLHEFQITEGYNIVIGASEIVIRSSSNHGAFNAIMTLVQIIEASDSREIGGMEIIDYPDMKVRGISDDISRGQVSTLENFKRIIRFIARYKMNTYMPYMEDVLQFKSFPTIGVGRGALKKEEVKEIINYAKKHFVEVIPIFQTLGHYENILTQDEFLEYAEFPGAASLCVAEEKTYAFLEEMLREVFEQFPSKYFHMGADESYDVGLGKSRHLVEAGSLADVHANHYKRVYDICKKYGKEVLMYGDIILRHPEILEVLPKDIIIVDWHYRADFEYKSTMLFKNAGHNYFVSPSVWNFTSTFPVNPIAIPNIKYITKSGIRNGASGMINSNWGDYGAETIKELVLYGYAWSAQCSWNFSGSNINNFHYNFFNDFFGMKDKRLGEIYLAFNNTFNQITWHEVWRHPLLEFRNPVWWESNLTPAVRLEWMNKTLPEIKKLIKEIKPLVKRNSGHLDIIDFLLGLNEWYKEKITAQYYLHKKLYAGKEDDDEFYEVNIERNDIREIDNILADTVDLKTMIQNNIAWLKRLKQSYADVWNKYYKPDNLNMIDDKFDRMIEYFNETFEQLNENRLQNPVINSRWIYCIKDSTGFYEEAEFEKHFEIKGKIKSAKLQLLGDTFARLYINGVEVDRVYARRSLSLLVDYRRIKYLNISDYLKEGENTIRVVAKNFNKVPAAGFNLISNIETDKNEYLILSDENWKARSCVEGNSNWSEAAVKEYPFIIIAPNFKTDRTSWIER